MSRLDDVQAFAIAIIARDVPMSEPHRDPRAAPRSTHPRLWAYLDHRSMAQVIAEEEPTPFRRHVEAWLIDARATVSNPEATPSQQELAARVIARWGL